MWKEERHFIDERIPSLYICCSFLTQILTVGQRHSVLHWLSMANLVGEAVAVDNTQPAGTPIANEKGAPAATAAGPSTAPSPQAGADEEKRLGPGKGVLF